MGKGQAPGIATGLGVCGAERSEAGWAKGAEGAGRRLRTAGFFLAAFFLADFLVGFFLAALPEAGFRVCFAAAPPAALVARRALRFTALLLDRFFALGAVFLFPAPTRRLAGRFLTAFLLWAMPSSL